MKNMETSSIFSKGEIDDKCLESSITPLKETLIGFQSALELSALLQSCFPSQVKTAAIHSPSSLILAVKKFFKSPQ